MRWRGVDALLEETDRLVEDSCDLIRATDLVLSKSTALVFVTVELVERARAERREQNRTAVVTAPGQLPQVGPVSWQ